MKAVKSIFLVLVLCLFFTLCFPASAEINVPNGTFSSNYFISYGVVLGDNGGHQLHIVFTTVGMGLCDELGVAVFSVDKLVELADGSNGWLTVLSDYPGHTMQNTSSYSYAANFQCIAGERYRVRATFYCAKTFPDGTSGSEHKSVTTGGFTVQ